MKHIYKIFLNQVLRIAVLLKFFAVTFINILATRRITRTKKVLKKSEYALILLTGPSLHVDLSKLHKNILSESDIWVVNSFATSEHYTKLMPRHYVFADSGYWDEDVSEYMDRLRTSVFNVITNQTNWEMILHFPDRALNSPFLSKFNINNLKVQFYNSNPLPYFGPIEKIFYQLGVSMPNSYNVLIAALFLTIYSNYSLIKILGADHSWVETITVNERNQIVLRQDSSFEKNRPFERVSNSSNGKTFFSNSELFNRWGQIFLQYSYLKKYARSKKIIVKNISDRSYIDELDIEKF